MEKSTGIELIAKERVEQIEKHGFTLSFDKSKNKGSQMSFGAALLCAPNPMHFASLANNYGCPRGWSPDLWKKMIDKPHKDRLVIAGALIAAEIDRLQNVQ